MLKISFATSTWNSVKVDFLLDKIDLPTYTLIWGFAFATKIK